MLHNDRMAARKRTRTRGTGTLIFTGRAYSWRPHPGADLIPLGTPLRDVAETLVEQILAGARPELHRATETFSVAVERIVVLLRRDGMVTADERHSRLLRYAVPFLGSMLVTEIRSGHISNVLAEAARTGLQLQTIKHLHNDLRAVFRELVRDEILEHNPARAEKVRIPKAPKDSRKRTLLTDSEFLQWEAAPTTRPQLRAMAWCSRGFGGMRNSDLHAWTWQDVDLEGWAHAEVPRPKTEHGERKWIRERLAMLAPVAAVLQAWWLSQGCPTSGPVFPLPAVRAHSRRTRKVPSYARELRASLLASGVDRLELHTPTRTSLPVDFYSFRRAWVTAINQSGMNSTLAMRATGHRSMTTHQRYVLPEMIEVPAAAVPVPAGLVDDFDAALENFDPTVFPVENETTALASGGYAQSVSTRDPSGNRIHVFGVRGLPDPPAQITPPCQEVTEMSWKDTILALFSTGPE